MLTAIPRYPEPRNETILSFLPGSPERAALKAALSRLSSQRIEIPLFIGGKAVHTGKTGGTSPPHHRHHVIGTFHQGGKEHVSAAIAAARKAQPEWAAH